MSYETLYYEGDYYPAFQATGNAARFIIPFAKEFCEGVGYDVGCNKPEWAFPGAQLADINLNGISADALPCADESLDYIFSSHMMEHYIGNWANLLDHWYSKLKPKGVLFLYLPSSRQKYWKIWNNRKHIHTLSPELMEEYFESCFDNTHSPKPNWKKHQVSGVDLNHSFIVVAQKK